MKFLENAQCYCCEEIATTRDHVPPKCFFPEKKYLSSGSPDYRRHLITIPSCSKHNNFRSRDDQYTAAVIAMNSDSELAFSIFKSKWVQTLLRHEGVLGKRIFSTARTAKVVSVRNGVLIPCETLAISYEIGRIERVIESIARALYYLETGYQKKWSESCIIKSHKYLQKDLSKSQDFCFLNQVVQAFEYGVNSSELSLAKKGSQPDVFYYQLFKPENGNSIIRMVFYGNFTFLAFLHEEGTIFNRII